MKNIFLLDADETLLDFRRGEREQLSSTLSTFGIKADDAVVSRFHDINDALWKKLERGQTTRKELVVERFRTLFDEFGFCADARLASARYYEYMKQAAYLIPGAEEFMCECKRRGRIYVVTNGSKIVQESRLQLSGITRYADGVFISEDVGADKPSACYAEHVEAHIPDYDRARAVWFGDSLTSDMGCAKTKNIDFVLYASERPEGYTGRLAASYREALEIFDGM